MSRIIKVNASSEYNIYLGNNELDNLAKYFNLNRKVLVVTDSNIPLEYVNKVLNSCLTLNSFIKYLLGSFTD